MSHNCKIYKLFFMVFLFLVFACNNNRKNLINYDWPQYRADASRSGFSPNQLDGNLSLEWKSEQNAPSPAWQGVHTRMPFDYAYQTVISKKRVFFGSSTDNKIYALNSGTGKEEWCFFTDAPVRFAPVIWKDRLFAGSDDGYLYCLSSKTGKLLWKKRGGPNDRMILGNDRMISRWPVRGGLVLKDNILYFAAGIWPSEGIYVYALNPKSGKVLWLNDHSGNMEWDQPHPTARAKSGISAQGYLVANNDYLFVPTGRAVPAALALENGNLHYFHLQKYREFGGSRVFATDSLLFITSGNTRNFQEIIGTKQAIFSAQSGERLTSSELNSPAMAVSPDCIIYFDSNEHKIKAVDPDHFLITSSGNKSNRLLLAQPVWTIKTPLSEICSLIATQNKIICGFKDNRIIIYDIKEKEYVWSQQVDGIPYGLAVAHNKLYISTDKGSIYCFAPDHSKTPHMHVKAKMDPLSDTNDNSVQAAEDIIRKTNIVNGYCLDYGCGDGRLAYELVKRTNLDIYAIDPDPQNVEKARALFDQTGLLGTRVTVHQSSLENVNYPDYFANLIVSARALNKGKQTIDTGEINRLLRPSGGKLCIGSMNNLETTTRPALEGAGDWTHQYCNPANTVTSADKRLRAPLEMLWFRDDRMEMPSRHGRGVSPLYSDGRLFVQGNHKIRAIDAYNGTTLWEYYIENLMKPYDQEHLTGTAITHGNWCLEGNRLYVRPGPSIANITGRKVLVLDTESGHLITEFQVPQAPDGKTEAYWGYIAIEKGILYGSIINQAHIHKWAYRESDMNQLFSESITFFAMDAETGKLKWIYPAEHSIRHNAIAVGNNRIYLIDRPVAQQDQISNPLMISKRRNVKLPHEKGKLVAMDAETGEIIYENNKNIYGTLVALSTKHDILVMSYQYTRFRSPSEKRGPMTAYIASTGKKIWETDAGLNLGFTYNFGSRLMINDTLIFQEPFAFHLKTGKKLDIEFDRTYACGILSGCRHLMLYRSSTLGYFDWTHPQMGTQYVGGIRPGCWINILPVGGLVLMPDATDRCNCSYLIKATIALKPQ